MKRAVLLLCIIIITLSGCVPKVHSRTFFAMDTFVEITGDKDGACEDEIKRIDALLSATNADSDISRYNRGESISEETQSLIDYCDKIREMTDGAFDITVQSAVELWDIKNAKVPPDDDKIKSAITDKSRIGLGAVAKGYAAGRVRALLESKGVKSAVLSLGGNVAVIGKKADGSEWNVGIQHPLYSDRLIATVKASDTAVVTSGGYQRYFEYEGKRYHHILDPKTGYPAQSGIISATVITKDDTLADALSTAVFVMGVDKAKKLYKAQDIELIMVTSDTVYVTEGLDVSPEDKDFKFEVITK